MTFLYPGFLWALFILTIPVLIHLFNLRRYKKLPFTNVRFLKELQKQTRSTRTLRQYLVLIARILALLFLVLAFAQPFIPEDGNQKGSQRNVVLLYVDNSFSMEAESERGPSLEVAKIRADEIVKNYKETDRFCIVTNDFTSSTRLINREQALLQISEIESGPDSRDIEEVIKRLNTISAASDETFNTSVFMLSDFQFVRKEIKQDLVDTTTGYYLLPIRAEVLRNISIDSIFFEDPMVKLNEPARIIAKVTNHGIEDREGVNVSLRIDSELKATTTLDLPANVSVTTGFDFVIKESGWKEARLDINDDPIVFDDALYFSFPVKENVKILDLYSEEVSADINRIFKNDAYYNFVPVQFTSIDYSGISSYDLVILDHLPSLSSGLTKVLETYIKNGGSLVLFPTESGQEDQNKLAKSLNGSIYDELRTEEMQVASIDFEDDLFDNVFEKESANLNLPVVKRYFAMTSGPGSTNLIQLRNTRPFLASTINGKGRFYQFAVPLDRSFGNLADHAILVPVMLKMSIQNSIRFPLWHDIGDMDPIRVEDEIRVSESGLRLVNNDYSIVPERIPGRSESLIAENGLIREAGSYQLLSGDRSIQYIAFNYSRSESETLLPDDEDLKEIFSQKNVRILDAISNNVGLQLKNEDMGRRFWAECLLLSLFFILIEILLLRFWPLRVKSPK